MFVLSSAGIHEPQGGTVEEPLFLWPSLGCLVHASKHCTIFVLRQPHDLVVY
jgi:hypothetical protein